MKQYAVRKLAEKAKEPKIIGLCKTVGCCITQDRNPFGVKRKFHATQIAQPEWLFHFLFPAIIDSVQNRKDPRIQHLLATPSTANSVRRLYDVVLRGLRETVDQVYSLSRSEASPEASFGMTPTYYFSSFDSPHFNSFSRILHMSVPDFKEWSEDGKLDVEDIQIESRFYNRLASCKDMLQAAKEVEEVEEEVTSNTMKVQKQLAKTSHYFHSIHQYDYKSHDFRKDTDLDKDTKAFQAWLKVDAVSSRDKEADRKEMNVDSFRAAHVDNLPSGYVISPAKDSRGPLFDGRYYNSHFLLMAETFLSQAVYADALSRARERVGENGALTGDYFYGGYFFKKWPNYDKLPALRIQALIHAAKVLEGIV